MAATKPTPPKPTYMPIPDWYAPRRWCRLAHRRWLTEEHGCRLCLNRLLAVCWEMMARRPIREERPGGAFARVEPPPGEEPTR